MLIALCNRCGRDMHVGGVFIRQNKECYLCHRCVASGVDNLPSEEKDRPMRDLKMLGGTCEIDEDDEEE